MIPISYDLSKQEVKNALLPYHQFVSHFTKNLNNAIKRGYIGNRKIDKSGNDLTLYLRGNELKLAKWLSTHMVRIAMIKAEHIELFISMMERVWEVSNNAYRLKWIHHLFVENGFDGGAFPKDALVKAVGADTCPYCNRNMVGHVDIRKVEDGHIVTKSLKGQLDHFYYKAKYPYLAISLNNLVPSCKDCNEYPNKQTEDAIATHLVSPYSIQTPDGLKFRIDYAWDLYACKVKEDDISIGFDVSGNPNTARNVYTFGLSDLYNRFHKDIAVRVNNAFIYTQNRKYQQGIDTMTQGLANQKADDYEEFKEAVGVVNSSQFCKKQLSKLATDIWYQLEKGL